MKGYHVTRTQLVPKIRKNGLLPMQTSNWLRRGNKERYGSGEIFAFDNMEDAIRWAANMDWEFNKATGTGKVTIIEFSTSDEQWEPDTADPLSQAASIGKWWKSLKRVAPEQIKSITPVTESLVKTIIQGTRMKTRTSTTGGQ